MAVVSPADAVETAQATFAIADWPGPVYMRLGRYPVPCVVSKEYKFEVGKATVLRDGGDISVFATGHMVCKTLEAAEALAKDGIEAKVINMSTIKPLDEECVREAAADVALVVSVEEHSIIGGLGSAVAECISETEGDAAKRPQLLRLGVRDVFGESGVADELLEKHRLTGKLIAEDIRRALK